MSAVLDTPAAVRAEPTSGGVRELIALALPIILTNLSSTLMMTTDAMMVGRLGATELGAVGYAGIWYWTVIAAFNGTGNGVQTFAAQAHGAGHARRCGPWLWQAWFTVVPAATIALVLFAVGFPALLDLLGPAAALRPLATSYVQARVFGVGGLMTGLLVAAFLRGVGDTRTPLYAMIAANLVNVALNYCLIFGHLGFPRLGVAGSGLATAIAEWVYALWLLRAVHRAAVRREFHTELVAPDRAAMRRFLRTSAPIGGQWSLDMLAFASFSTLVARMGASEMAASQALLSLMHLSFMQVVGVQMAVATMVGRYVGAGDVEAARRSLRSALRVGVGLSLLVAALFVAAPELCLRLFVSDETVLRLGAPLLAVGAAFQVCDAFGVLNGGALRGAGDTRWPFVVQTLLAWGLFLPAAYAGGALLGGGLTGAWMGGVVYVAALGLALHWRFQSGAWQEARI
ncbi:MAG TPA: MATE family efflux transporter [Candidatus Dormibacteraeota bacterium]|nr:MATE family efflux transporter [Candidatus Dormibacteraeota bacterium]